MKRAGALALAVGLLVLAVVGGTAAPALAAPKAPVARPGRLLIISVPGLTWKDVVDQDLPSLEGFFATSALADLAPRGVRARSGPGDAYLTISAGARATTARDVDGQVLALAESSARSTAGEIFSRRTGAKADGPYVSLSWPTLIKANKAKPYDAKPGILAASLESAGLSVAAIGNADGTDSTGPSYERQVALGLVDRNGVLASGSVGKDLLRDDPATPFGVRLDHAAVVHAAAAAWAAAAPHDGSNGGVVLVEASDLARTLRYRPMVDRARYAQMWAGALQDTDRLVGELLAGVDLSKDSVLVLAPYNRLGDRDLTAVALHRPGTKPGYLQSASTQRAGFLTLVDVAPTVLDTFGVARPDDMEGRPAELSTSTATIAHREAHLVSLNGASRFRERLLVPTTMFAVLGLVLVTAGAVGAIAGRWRRPWPAVLRFAALVDLAVLPASYLARGFPLERLGIGFYWAFTIGVGIGVAVLATLASRWTRRPGLDLVAVLALVGGVLVADVVSGSHLSLSAAFGYSPTGNSRLYGISNYSYGMLATAVCVLASLLLGARPGRNGRIGAIGLLGATLVVLGVPVWGSDVGGILAFTPTVGFFAALVLGWRIRVRSVAIGLLATLISVSAFGFLDLSRPADQRGHLGRLFERIGNEGPGPLIDIVSRKLVANLHVSTSSFWVLAIPIAALFGWFLVKFPSHPLTHLRARFPGLAKGGAAAVLAAILGSLVNDSGAIVGGVAALVLTAAVVHLCLQLDLPLEADLPLEPEP